MANNLLTYSGITAKVKAMESNLFKSDDYNKICNLETIPEFINFLKANPSYAPIFSGIDEGALHRGEIEHLIVNSLYDSYSRIYRFCNQEQRHALTFLSFRFETNIIKYCLQHVFNNEYEYKGSNFDVFFCKRLKVSLEQLSTAKSIDEFINCLRNTEYYPILKAIQNTNNPTLFDYEMQLDIYYFTKVWKLKDKYLKGDSNKAYTEILGKKIDLLNVLWIYRSKKYYDIEPSKIYSYIIPISYKLKKKEITTYIESNTVEELVTFLNTSYYVRVNGITEITSFENLYKVLITKVYSTNKQKYPNSMAPVQNYLYLKELEIDKLTTVLECIRYKLQPNETLNYIQ
ncbi:V0D/AC39 family V-type ATPase subunit [Anaerosporobacter faecicola]|uniref:V0D/AC39 family V-type ATPase subunit n=1 Tax=Anaerosporobacter faecicola TaxID=2718714 RepID=UPI00143C1AF2|nr:V-type ATPase subunit [Anaerosporobacter faecicola]